MNSYVSYKERNFPMNYHDTKTDKAIRLHEYY